MLYDYYNYERSPLPRLFFIVIDGTEKKKTELDFLFLVFIDHQIPRFGRKYYARIFEFPGRGPAVSLNTSGIARSFSIFPAAALPYLEYEQVSALFLYDPAILSFEQKSLSLSQFFFSLLSSLTD